MKKKSEKALIDQAGRELQTETPPLAHRHPTGNSGHGAFTNSGHFYSYILTCIQSSENAIRR